MSDAPIVITTTCPDKAIAEIIAKSLLTQKLAACVQILPEIKSYYIWNDEMTSDTEILLLIKTVTSHFSVVEKLILENHPYDVPQILSLRTDKIHPPYEEWLKKTINK